MNLLVFEHGRNTGDPSKCPMSALEAVVPALLRVVLAELTGR